MPIVEQVYSVIHQNVTPQQALHNLLSRQPRHE